MSYTKYLFAIHRDGVNTYRTKIAQGTSADFATAIGFQVENIVDKHDNKTDGFEPMEGLDGTYPVLTEEAMGNLQGKLLTLCDATFTNKEQRESFKSLVKDSLWSSFGTASDLTQNNYEHAEDIEGVRVQK